MRTLVGFIALLIGLSAAVSAVAQNSGLKRLTDRDDLLGWEGVGRLDLDGVGFCTGTLIASDLVLTAAHCVYDPRSRKQIQAGRMVFRAGLRDGTAIAERRVFAVAAAPGYKPGHSLTPQNLAHDVALLRLEAPITSTDADPFALHGAADPVGSVSVVSYGRGRAEALSRQRECQVVARQGALMAFDCAVTFGSSGAPVFAPPPPGSGRRGRILSIVSGGTTLDGRPVALGMILPQTVSALKADLRRKGTPDRAAAGIRRVGVGDNRAGTGARFVRP